MIYVWNMGMMEEELKDSTSSSGIGFVATKDFSEVYDFWWPDTFQFKNKGLCLNPVTFDCETMDKSHFRSLYNNSKLSYKFANWNHFWEWMILEIL